MTRPAPARSLHGAGDRYTHTSIVKIEDETPTSWPFMRKRCHRTSARPPRGIATNPAFRIASFYRPPVEVGAHGTAPYDRAVVSVTELSIKGTERNPQAHAEPLLVQTGEEYARIPFAELHRRLCDILRGNRAPERPSASISITDPLKSFRPQARASVPASGADRAEGKYRSSRWPRCLPPLSAMVLPRTGRSFALETVVAELDRREKPESVPKRNPELFTGPRCCLHGPIRHRQPPPPTNRSAPFHEFALPSCDRHHALQVPSCPSTLTVEQTGIGLGRPMISSQP